MEAVVTALRLGIDCTDGIPMAGLLVQCGILGLLRIRKLQILHCFSVIVVRTQRPRSHPLIRVAGRYESKANHHRQRDRL